MIELIPFSKLFELLKYASLELDKRFKVNTEGAAWQLPNSSWSWIIIFGETSPAILLKVPVIKATFDIPPGIMFTNCSACIIFSKDLSKIVIKWSPANVFYN